VTSPAGQVTLTLTATQRVFVSVEATFNQKLPTMDTYFGVGAQGPSGVLFNPDLFGTITSGAFTTLSATRLFTPGAGTWTFGAMARVFNEVGAGLSGAGASHVSVIVLN
jgi:hypothetical protein